MTSEATIGPGADLQAALDALDPGEALRLGPGDHVIAAPLRLRRGVRIRGAGATRTRIVRARSPHVHVAAAHVPGCEELVLEDLTLGWRDGEDAAGAYLFDSDVLVVAGGRVVLRGCHLVGSAAEHAKVDDMYGGAGLRAYGDAVVRAEGCEIRGHGGHGVLAGERADVAIAEGWVAGNRGIGLLVVGEAAAEARATAFADNAHGGIVTADAARLALADVVVQGNRRLGVRLDARAEVRLDGCTVEANGGPGVQVAAGGLVLTGGAVRANAGDGLAVAAGLRVAASDLVLADNRGFGAALGTGATLDLARVAIFGNARGDVDRAD